MTEPFVEALQPLLEAVGASVVPLHDADESDVRLMWNDGIAAVIRLPDMHGALDRQVAVVEAELGGPLAGLPFEQKRRAVVMLEERGAFTIRKGVERVADAMGVSRFTIYSYLNASRANDEETTDA